MYNGRITAKRTAVVSEDFVKACLLLGVEMFIALSPIYAQDGKPEAVTKVTFLHGSSVEPFRDEISLAQAAKSLDDTAITWIRKHKCGSCHTGWPYMMARAVLKDEPSSSMTEIRTFFEDRITNWDADEEIKKHQHREIVGTSTALAIHDAQVTGKLHSITREALDRMWKLQRKDGAWSWPKCSWPPFEVDDYYGALLAAVGVGHAPENYLQSESAKVGVEKLRAYLTGTTPPNLHHRTWLLWASVKFDGLLSDDQKQTVVRELLAIQRADGGWSMESLGREWVGRNGEEADLDAPSDGYGTGLVVYALRQAGMPISHDSIQRGKTWLVSHQRESGRWFTRSLNGVEQNYISDTATVFAVLALDACK